MASMTPVDGNKEATPNICPIHQLKPSEALLKGAVALPSQQAIIDDFVVVKTPNTPKHVKKLLKIYLQSLIHPHFQMRMMVNPLSLSHQRKGKKGLTFMMCHQKMRMIMDKKMQGQTQTQNVHYISLFGSPLTNFVVAAKK